MVENITITIAHAYFRPCIQILTKFLITLGMSKFFRNFMFMDSVANSVIRFLSITDCYIFCFYILLNYVVRLFSERGKANFTLLCPSP